MINNIKNTIQLSFVFALLLVLSFSSVTFADRYENKMDKEKDKKEKMKYPPMPTPTLTPAPKPISKINLQLYKPLPTVKDAENFYDLVVVNQGNANYKGNFEINAELSPSYNINYVDYDTRLNCEWSGTKVKCVTKAAQDAGMDTTYKIRVKYWVSATNTNPLNFKAILTTNSTSQANIYQVVNFPY